MHVFHIKNT